METIRLDGAWRVRPEPLPCAGRRGLARIRKARTGWLAAAVPGEIHLDLMRAVADVPGREVQRDVRDLL